MERVMRAWAQAQTQAERSALLMQRQVIETELALASMNLRLAYEELEVAASIGNAEREEMLALEQELGVEAARNTFRYQQLAAVVNDSNGYYAAGQAAIERLTFEMDVLNTALRENISAEKALELRYASFTRTTQELTESGAVPLKDALDDASDSVGNLRDRIEYGLDTIRGLRDRIKELNEELETTSDPDRRIALQLEITDLEAQVAAMLAAVQAAIDALEDVTPVTITPTVTVDYETLNRLRAEAAAEQERWANSRAQQFEREETA